MDDSESVKERLKDLRASLAELEENKPAMEKDILRDVDIDVLIFFAESKCIIDPKELDPLIEQYKDGLTRIYTRYRITNKLNRFRSEIDCREYQILHRAKMGLNVNHYGS